MSPPEVAMCPDSDVSVNDSFKFRSSLIQSSDVVGTKGFRCSQWNVRTQRFIWSSTGNNDENFDEAYCIKTSKETEPERTHLHACKYICHTCLCGIRIEEEQSIYSLSKGDIIAL
ncbi:uncharacterized protein V6R79_000736 [Siganus canaliculatus]